MAHTAVAGLIPLLIPGLPHASELLNTLRGPRFALGQVHLVPSYDLTGSGFDPARYWRGPSWFNTAWLIVQAGDPTNGLLPIFALPPRDMAIGVGLMVLMGLLAGVMPAVAAMRLKITDALRRT